MQTWIVILHHQDRMQGYEEGPNAPIWDKYKYVISTIIRTMKLTDFYYVTLF